MQFKTIAAAALLATSVSAYQVLTPSANSTITKGSTITVKWSAVDTDADIFSVYLTNFQTHHWPPTVLSLAQNVPRDDLSIDLRIPCDVSSDFGWQLNFINGTNTYVIYAQSPVFSLRGDCTDPAPTLPTPTGYRNSTVTVKETATATLCKTVSTIVYATPIVWFVEPSKEAVCDVKTVTVYPGSKPTSTPGGGKGPYTTPAPTYKPTGTGAAGPTSPPTFTGAASSVQVSGFMALIVGAVAFML